MNTNVDSRFATLQGQFGELKAELTSLKLGVATPHVFEKLGTRVFNLESNTASADNPDVKFLQTQLDRLDPANKTITMIGFKGEDVATRTRLIDEFLPTNFASLANRIDVEHVFKGNASSEESVCLCSRLRHSGTRLSNALAKSISS